MAVAASRLGAKTAFLGKVGNDAFGAYLRQVLADNGVDGRGLRTGEQATSMAIVSVDETGERSFRFVRGADRDLPPEGVDEDEVLKSKILHFGSVSLTAGLSRNATIFAARTAHRNGGLVSYDPNYRPALWGSQAEAAEWMTIPLPLVDILKASEEELPLLTGTSDLEEGTRILEDRGISLVMVTLGGEGCFCRWKGRPGVSPASPSRWRTPTAPGTPSWARC